MTSSTAFDVEEICTTYRRVVARIEKETTPDGKEEFQRIALRLRQKWAKWQGEDCLHETVFGEPDE